MGTVQSFWMEMTMTDSNNHFMILKVRRVFKCKKDNSLLFRKNVYKDEKGKYRCNRCHEEVQDITSTTTGHDFLEVLAL